MIGQETKMRSSSNRLRSIFKTWRKKQQPSLTLFQFQYLAQLVGQEFNLDNNLVEEHSICGVYKSEINCKNGEFWAESLSKRYSRCSSRVDTVSGNVVNYYHRPDVEELDILMINNNYVISEKRRTSMGRIRAVYRITLNRFCNLLVDSVTLKYDKKKIRQ